MYFIGLDLGQKQDFSAVAVVERADCLHVKHLERIPLGTPYAKVVGRVSEMARHPALAGNAAMVVDATGVGAPVVEMLRQVRLPCRVTAVTITGGEHAHGRGEDWHVPKKDLMAAVQVLLENGELKIHRGLEAAPALVRELTEIRAQRNKTQSGEHDDLALAVALACWRARRLEVGQGRRRLPGI
jgi:hypothetical protein